MLKEIIASLLFATPIGLVLVVGLCYLGWLLWQEHKLWQEARLEAEDEDEDPVEVDGEEVVYR